jgi:hypothetical protein
MTNAKRKRCGPALIELDTFRINSLSRARSSVCFRFVRGWSSRTGFESDLFWGFWTNFIQYIQIQESLFNYCWEIVLSPAWSLDNFKCMPDFWEGQSDDILILLTTLMRNWIRVRDASQKAISLNEIMPFQNDRICCEMEKSKSLPGCSSRVSGSASKAKRMECSHIGNGMRRSRVTSCPKQRTRAPQKVERNPNIRTWVSKDEKSLQRRTDSENCRTQ